MGGLQRAREEKGWGLGLLWNNDLNIDLMSLSLNHIDVRVRDEVVNTDWRFTGFYGNPEEANKSLLWDLLNTLSVVSTLP